MSCFNCCKYIDNNILPFADFLHTPISFPLTKKATKSYFGIFLSFIMIMIFSYLCFTEIRDYKSNYTVSYSQEFIPRERWNGRNITFGFNVSENFSDKLNFSIEDSEGESLELDKCDENLNIINNTNEIKNSTYYCITNYSLKINNLKDYALKINVFFANESFFEKKEYIPFSLAIREPKIQHNNFENPLDINNNSTINKFRCVFDTRDVSSFRRYLNLISYYSKGGFYNDKSIIGSYLDDFEDSRKKSHTEEDGLLIGTYRIIVSKKAEIYTRKYIGIKDFFSKIGGYISLLMSIFSILCKILVNPNDNYRIFDYLKKKKSIHLDIDAKSIYDDLKINNKSSFNDFNKTIMDNRWFSKTRHKFKHFFLRFLCCCKTVRPLSIVSRYIEENLTIENYLETQILGKKLLKNINRIDELKAQYLNIFKNKKKTILSNNIQDIVETNQKKEKLISYETVEMNEYNHDERSNTVLIENESDTNSFNEKQQEDIIKIVLKRLF